MPESFQGLFGEAMTAGSAIKDCIVSIQSGDMFVLCMSDVLSPEMAQTFHGAGECVQINQPDLFFHRVTKELRRRFGGAIGFLGVFPCNYVDSRRFEYTDPAAEMAAYLLKPHRYANQREYRALWQCNQLVSDMGYIDIVCPRLGSLCSLIDFKVHEVTG